MKPHSVGSRAAFFVMPNPESRCYTMLFASLCFVVLESNMQEEIGLSDDYAVDKEPINSGIGAKLTNSIDALSIYTSSK